MKKFLLFVVGLAAVLVLLANLGPMVLLGLSLWLLYIIFKKFVQSDSVIGKIGWVILGLLVLSIAFSNIFSLVGLAAAFVLYLIYKSWTKESDDAVDFDTHNDPFTNFEKEWANLN